MRKHGKKQGRVPSQKIRRFALIGMVVAVFALGVTAAVSLRTGGAKASTTKPSGGQSIQTRANPNLTIPLDPQTGQVRPLTQEEAQRMAEGIKQLVNQSTEGLQSVQHADGSVSMDLQGRFQNIAVAKLDEDGKLTQSCIDNPESAAAFFEIDPQLLGVKKSANTSRINNAVQKGRDR